MNLQEIASEFRNVAGFDAQHWMLRGLQIAQDWKTTGDYTSGGGSTGEVALAALLAGTTEGFELAGTSPLMAFDRVFDCDAGGIRRTVTALAEVYRVIAYRIENPDWNSR